MFSIIIPLYNKVPYVEKTIRSVAAQTFQEFELIVIDDGSQDDGMKKVEDLFHSLTPPLGGWRAVSQINQGVSTARNNGVKIAKYDYITFLDADDWWEPTYLVEMKSLIEKYPEAGIYGSSYYKVKNGKYIPANIGVEKDFQRGLINFCQVYVNTMYMPLCTSATIIKKDIFESNKGFKPSLKLGEDFDLWISVVMKYPLGYLYKPLVYYNQDVEQINRAIGNKLYEPKEHMLFTDYGELKNNSDFKNLFEALAVYGLIPYYLAGKNKTEVNTILSKINWKNHAFKYQLYYKYLPKTVVKFWFKALKIGSKCKSLLIKYV